MSIRRSLMIAQFPGNGTTAWQVARYVANLTAHLENDPRINRVEMWDLADTPITMSRNRALLAAEKAGIDYLLMIDSDMVPDMYPAGEHGIKPFFQSTLDFMLAHNGPCVVAAPYCGPPPNECVYVFQWVNFANDDPGFSIQMYERSEATKLEGIQRAAALPTGLILIDMRAVELLPHPRFYYEWKDETESQKASTEDVVFTRDLTCVGVPVYCNWDAWAGHIKTKVVGRPEIMSPNAVPRLLRKTGLANALDGVTVDEPPRPIRPENRHPKLPYGFPPSLAKRVGIVELPDDNSPPIADLNESASDVAHANGQLVEG